MNRNCFTSKLAVMMLLVSVIFVSIAGSVFAAGTQYYYDKYNTAPMGIYTKSDVVTTNNYSLSYYTNGWISTSGYDSYSLDSSTGAISFGGSYGTVAHGGTKYSMSGANLFSVTSVWTGGAWDYQGAGYNIVNNPTYSKGALVASGLVLPLTYPANGKYTDSYWYVKTGDTAVKNVVVQSNIIADDGTYPNDGLHSDNFWYVKKTVYDISPPTATVNPSTPTNQDVTVTVTYNATAVTKQYKIGAGVYQAYTAPFTVSANDTIYFKSQDAIGSWSNEGSLAINNIDKTPPTIPIIGVDNPGPTNGDVTVTITYSGDSDIRQYQIDSGPWTGYTGPFDVSSNCTVNAHGTDAVGNTSADATKIISNIDKLNPTVTADDTNYAWRAAGTNGTLNYADAGSGISTSQYKLTHDTNAPGSWDNYTGPVAINDGTWYLHYKAVDAAGNTLTGNFGPYRIDTVNPTVNADDTNFAWRPAGANVALSFADAGSGIATSQYKLTNDANAPGSWDNYTGPVAISDGTWYLHYKAVDVAGNTLAGNFGPYKIDQAAPPAPSITPNPGGDISSSPYTVTVSPGAGSISGVASTEYRLSGGTTQDWAAYSAPFAISTDDPVLIEARDIGGSGLIGETASRTLHYYGNLLATATAAVEAAEAAPSSATLSAARLLVNGLPAAAPEKTLLTARLDLVEQYIMIDQGLLDLSAALDTADADTTVGNVNACQVLADSLQALISALPSGATKAAYQSELDALLLQLNTLQTRLAKIQELTLNLNNADLILTTDPGQLQLETLLSPGMSYTGAITDIDTGAELIGINSTGSLQISGAAQGHNYRVTLAGILDGVAVAHRTFDKQKPDTAAPVFAYGYTLNGILYVAATDNHQLHAAPYAFRIIGDGEDISPLQNFIPSGSGYNVVAWTMGNEGDIVLSWQIPPSTQLQTVPKSVIVYARDYSLNRADIGLAVTASNQVLFGGGNVPQSVLDQIAVANQPPSSSSDSAITGALTPGTKTEVTGSLQGGNLTVETQPGEINSGTGAIVIDLKKDLSSLNSVVQRELGTKGTTFYRITVTEKSTGRLVYSNFVFNADQIVIPDLQDSTLYVVRIAVVNDSKVLAFRDVEKMTQDRTAPVIERILVQGDTLTVIARDNLALNALPYQFLKSGSVFASEDWLLDVGQLMAINFDVNSWTKNATLKVNSGESLRILVRDAQNNYTLADVIVQPKITIDIVNPDIPYNAGTGSKTNLQELLLQILKDAGKSGTSVDNYTLSVSDPALMSIEGNQLIFKNAGTGYLILTDKRDGAVIKYQITIGGKMQFDRKIVVQINSEINLAKAFEKVLIREFGEGATVGFVIKPGDEDKGLLYDGSIYKSGDAEGIVTVYAGTTSKMVPLYLLIVTNEYPLSDVEAFRINLPFVLKAGDAVALSDITKAISGLAEKECSKWTIYETESDALRIDQNRITAVKEGIALVRAIDLANGAVTDLTFQIIAMDASNASYSDTADHWSTQTVAAATAKGLLCGYGDGTYRPDNGTTREEFLAVVSRIKAFGRNNPVEVRQIADLRLTHSGWSYYLVHDALNGLTPEEINHVFGAEANLQSAITREEAAALIAKALNLQPNTANPYTDLQGAGKTVDIQAVTGASLMIGYGDGRFGSGNTVTRAEMAQIALRLIDNNTMLAKLAMN